MKPRPRKLSDVEAAERRVLDAALKENRCRCQDFVCKHLGKVWKEVDKLEEALRRRGWRKVGGKAGRGN